LLRICNALDVNAGDLITQASQQQKIIVVKKSEWEDTDLSHTGFVTRRFFSPEERTVLDSAILVLAPGKSIPVRKNIKQGQEILCVLRGEIVLILSDVKYALAEGDSVHFRSNPENQRITNNSNGMSFVLWVGTL